MKENKLVFGVGINDAEYVVQKCIRDGNKRRLVWACPYYQRWCDMLRRCYSEAYHKNKPTYINCTVNEDWHRFSVFSECVDNQPNLLWKNCQLDKDLLVVNNKEYGPETCVFISRQVNMFLTDRERYRGEFLIGCTWSKGAGKFQAKCGDPFNKGSCYLGSFDNEYDAHVAWKNKKYEYACELALLQEDERVADALRARFK